MVKLIERIGKDEFIEYASIVNKCQKLIDNEYIKNKSFKLKDELYYGYKLTDQLLTTLLMETFAYRGFNLYVKTGGTICLEYTGIEVEGAYDRHNDEFIKYELETYKKDETSDSKMIKTIEDWYPSYISSDGYWYAFMTIHKIDEEDDTLVEIDTDGNIIHKDYHICIGGADDFTMEVYNITKERATELFNTITDYTSKRQIKKLFESSGGTIYYN